VSKAHKEDEQYDICRDSERRCVKQLMTTRDSPRNESADADDSKADSHSPERHPRIRGHPGSDLLQRKALTREDRCTADSEQFNRGAMGHDRDERP
jgi:hypothetical protein